MKRLNDQIIRDLTTDLRLSDQETGGHPLLPSGSVGTARHYLKEMLLDPAGRLRQHVAHLERLYQASFVAPLPRLWDQGAAPRVPAVRAGFRHRSPLPDSVALSLLDGGVDRLPEDELARLLLNPYALWDLADLIGSLLPDHWLDQMEDEGVRLARETGTDLYEGFEEVVLGDPLVEDPLSARSPSYALRRNGGRSGESWLERYSIEVSDAMRGRISALAFGSRAHPFELFLRCVPADGGQFTASLEMRPAPTREDVLIAVRFPNGEEREFVLKVPTETRREPFRSPRDEMLSEPSIPLSADTFRFRGLEWRLEGNRMVLILE